jgi:hypothetical protein
MQLRLMMFDSKFTTDDFGDNDTKVYLAWANTLRRTLVALGVEPAAAKTPTLADYFAGRNVA